MDQGEDNHVKNLEQLCRICCGKLDKSRSCKKITDFKEVLLEHFEIDIENDKTVVHPTCVCEKCRKVLTKVKQFSKKKSNNVISYQPQLIFFDFKVHSHICSECECFDKIKKGGRPLKSWTNRHNIVINNTIKSANKLEVIGSKEKPSFYTNVIVEHSEKLRYVYVPSESFMSFILFHKPQEMFQLENLVTVNIDKISNTWNVLIGANDVSNTLLSMFKIQPIISSKADAFDLLNDCAKLKFCVGNEDFSDIFQDKNNDVIAKEVCDVICKSYGVETTIRHVECELIVGKNNRCIKCRNYRPCLRALRSKQHNQKKKRTWTTKFGSFFYKQPLFNSRR